eukprot:114307_1
MATKSTYKPLLDAFNHYTNQYGEPPSNAYDFHNFIQINNVQGINVKDIGPFLMRYKNQTNNNRLMHKRQHTFSKSTKSISKSARSAGAGPHNRERRRDNRQRHIIPRSSTARSPSPNNRSRIRPHPPPRSHTDSRGNSSNLSRPNGIAYAADENVLHLPSRSPAQSIRSTHSEDNVLQLLPHEQNPTKPNNIFSKSADHSQDNVLSVGCFSHSSFEDMAEPESREDKQHQIHNLCDVISELRMQIRLLALKDEQRTHELETMKSMRQKVSEKYNKLKKKYNTLKTKYKAQGEKYNELYKKKHAQQPNSLTGITKKYGKLKDEHKLLKRKMRIIHTQYDNKCKEYSKLSTINDSRANELRRCIGMNADLQKEMETKTTQLNEWKHKHSVLYESYDSLLKRLRNMEEMTDMYQNEYERLLQTQQEDDIKNNGAMNKNGGSDHTQDTANGGSTKDSEIEHNKAADQHDEEAAERFDTDEAIAALLELQRMQEQNDVDVADSVVYSLSDSETVISRQKDVVAVVEEDKEEQERLDESDDEDSQSSSSSSRSSSETDAHKIFQRELNLKPKYDKKKKFSVYSVDQDANYKIIDTHFNFGATHHENLSYTKLDFDDLQSVRFEEPKSETEMNGDHDGNVSDSLSSSSY